MQGWGLSGRNRKSTTICTSIAATALLAAANFTSAIDTATGDEYEGEHDDDDDDDDDDVHDEYDNDHDDGAAGQRRQR